MKNLFSFFAFVIVLLLTSCSKEELPQVETLSTDTPTAISKVFEAGNTLEDNPNYTVSESRNSSSIPVSKVTYTIDGDKVIADFSASHNFKESVLEATQTLDFEDASGNSSTLTFRVVSYDGDENAIEVTYSIGGNNLGGLDLKGAQIIIIDEVII